MDAHEVARQLTKIYDEEEWWHVRRMPWKIAYDYHKKLYLQGNIKIVEDLDVILGYYELYFINREQLKRITVDNRFCADGEDIQSGDIAYLANCWVDKKLRRGWVFKRLYDMFMKQSAHCRMIAGEVAKRSFELKLFMNRRKVWEKKNSLLQVLQ